MLRKWSPKNGHGIHTCIQYTQYKCCNTLSDPTSLPIGSRWLHTYLISLSIKLPTSWFAFEEPQPSDLSSRSTHGGPWHPFTHQGKRYHVALLDGWQLTCLYQAYTSATLGYVFLLLMGWSRRRVGEGWWNLFVLNSQRALNRGISINILNGFLGSDPKKCAKYMRKYRKVFLYMMKTELTNSIRQRS